VRSGSKPNSQTGALLVPGPTRTDIFPLEVLAETEVAPSRSIAARARAMAAVMVALSDPTNYALPFTTTSGV